MSLVLYEHQQNAIKRLKNGCILCGGTGTGKSITALAYYFTKICNGKIGDDLKFPTKLKPLYIITTAQKRDKLEWDDECSKLLLATTNNVSEKYSHPPVIIDSWNNIAKYSDIKDAFFIFDEQRVVGYGKWSKTFIKISKNNKWILLSATPGDTWMDYVPVFIANKFYKNKTEFIREHVVYNRYTKYPKVEKYIHVPKLINYRNLILVNMRYKKKTIKHDKYINVDYDHTSYERATKDRWDVYKNEPIINASSYCYLLRRISNSSEEKIFKIKELLSEHNKMIIFYNFDYELDMLRLLKSNTIKVAEWNGHKHESIPTSKKWLYLVQYTAGSEGWNCIETDTIVFFSQSYSYRQMHQASGRIDRINTEYTNLYYYWLTTNSSIDLQISKALSNKQNFNETAFYDIRKE